MNEHDKIFRTIERLTGRMIIFFHSEAKNYAFKTFDGKWHIIDKEFIDYAAQYKY